MFESPRAHHLSALAGLFLVLLFGVSSAAADELPRQLIRVTPTNPNASPSSALELVVRYDTNPPEQYAIGLGLALHWSSKQLTFVRVEDVYANGLVGTEVQDDTADGDGDPDTDQRLTAAWVFSDSPPVLPPIDLYTVVFTATPDFCGSTLRFRDTGVAAGFDFDAPPVNVTSTAAELDVDCDGTTEPLTDGVLLLRYLFGFRGDDLVRGAIGSQCARCAAPQIESHLEGLL